MILDGVFLHHLVDELQIIKNKRIHKIDIINQNSFIFNIQGRIKLFFTLTSDSCHLRLTNMDVDGISQVTPFFLTLKKYVESAIIKDIFQINNDRTIQINLISFDDLGFEKSIYLIFELFGRNSNFFILDEDFIIIDCFKKTYVLEDDNKRILTPKSKFEFITNEKINPFKTTIINDQNNYEGVSKLTYSEIIYRNDLLFLKNEIKPLIYQVKNKYIFSCFVLNHLDATSTSYDSLSQVLENYYLLVDSYNLQNSNQLFLENYINKEISKVHKKISKQQSEKQQALKNLDLERIGNILSANIYKIQRFQKSITLEDFYNNNELITIELNPNISPANNVENIFKRYKKAKRSIDLINEQIIASKKDLLYLECLLNQVKISKERELQEIIDELGLNKIKQNQRQKKKQKPQLLTFNDNQNNQILVGKNNYQNNYLTHTIAKKDDYFFHVKDIPGSHTVLKTDNLSSDVIILAAQIAAYYSKARDSSNVAVDYTLVKNVKKIPGQKGSFVIYTNHKTVYVTPDIDIIKRQTN